MTGKGSTSSPWQSKILSGRVFLSRTQLRPRGVRGDQNIVREDPDVASGNLAARDHPADLHNGTARLAEKLFWVLFHRAAETRQWNWTTACPSRGYVMTELQ